MDLIPILSALAMAAATAPAAEAVAPAAPAVAPDPWLGKGFLYYRAVAFRGMVAGQMCGGGAVRSRFDALSSRLEKARRSLSKQSGHKMFEVKKDDVKRAPQCSDGAGFMLSGFEAAVAAVEAAAKK